MLIGQYKTSLGAKRRVAIPSKFRKILGSKIIIARFYEGCLVMVGEDSWQALLKRVTAETKVVTATIRDTERFILGSAYELETDSQGRVVIPENLKNYAQLKTEVVFLGLRDRVELWGEQNWKKREEEIAGYSAYLLERIAKENA